MMESTIDLIVCWPRNADYPVWRQMIRNDRARFAKVIIVFTETYHGNDYRRFVRDAMSQDSVTFVDGPLVRYDKQDWRNIAVNKGLEYSDANWVFFTEEDFFWANGMWDAVAQIQKTDHRVIGFYDDKRLHPCCLFLRRDILGEIDKNFGIVVDKLDHFGLIQKQLEAKGEKIASLNGQCVHLAGLSHNLRLLAEGKLPNHGIEMFQAYLGDCLEVEVPLPADMSQMYEDYLTAAGVKI